MLYKGILDIEGSDKESVTQCLGPLDPLVGRLPFGAGRDRGVLTGDGLAELEVAGDPDGGRAALRRCKVLIGNFVLHNKDGQEGSEKNGEDRLTDMWNRRARADRRLRWPSEGGKECGQRART